MRKPYPAHLPGEELQGFHFSQKAAARLSKAEIEKELQPLWELARKKGWASDTDCIEFGNLCGSKRTTAVWKNAQEWGGKILWQRTEESKAAAGWLLLKNLQRAHVQWQAFFPPYQGLRPPTYAAFQESLRLWDIFSPENSHMREKNLLGMALASLPAIDYAALGRVTLQHLTIGLQKEDLIIAVSHGTKIGEKWIGPTPENIRMLWEKIEKELPQDWKNRIDDHRNKFKKYEP